MVLISIHHNYYPLLHYCLSFTRIVKSEITEQPMPVNVSINNVDNIILTCSAEGFPLPIITWQHNGQVLNESDRISINPENDEDINEVTSTVVVSEPVLSETGLYQCIIQNLPVYEPVMSDSVTVLVQGKLVLDY